MNNYKKHKLLGILYNHWKKGEDSTTSSYEVTDFGRSLTIINLQKESSYNIKTIEDICVSLCKENFIDKIRHDTNNKSHRYLILESGKVAYIDKLFLYKFWLFNFDFWKWILPFLVGLLGLLNSIFRWVEK